MSEPITVRWLRRVLEQYQGDTPVHFTDIEGRCCTVREGPFLIGSEVEFDLEQCDDS